ncbi:sterol desaturase [Aspergillus steynii IBT 23096]|uniref:Sterol desaturase n=1 Tax=Aspergillus steynii IBT 23096 TaxID=1392250 RepID=A0A2I2GNR5_9EURO|nr:sterol desaturase [Aspergillus steynii IBT 23096]PLB54518.1 sterol desaturase [Aspergillus steynii IBT 23096]
MDLHSQLQAAWSHATTTYRPGTIEFAAIILVQIVGFLIPASFYLLIDTLFPKFSQRHKIQDARRQPTRQQILHCVKVTLFNHVWSVALAGLMLSFTGLDHAITNLDPIVPPFKTFLVDFAFGLLAREISFYYVHRALHHPSVYVYIHKMHHKYTAPVAFAAEYAHPVEHLLANVLPITLPLYLKGAHMLSLMAFVLFELWEAAADHSGYDFLKLPPAEIHDLHHEKFRVNYGTIGLMDWIHGTDVVGWDLPKKNEIKRME